MPLDLVHRVRVIHEQDHVRGNRRLKQEEIVTSGVVSGSGGGRAISAPATGSRIGDRGKNEQERCSRER